MVRIYKVEETELVDFADEVTEMGQPLHLYQYQDGYYSWILVSTNEIADDDLENFIEKKIEEYEEENDDD